MRRYEELVKPCCTLLLRQEWGGKLQGTLVSLLGYWNLFSKIFGQNNECRKKRPRFFSVEKSCYLVTHVIVASNADGLHDERCRDEMLMS